MNIILINITKVKKQWNKYLNNANEATNFKIEKGNNVELAFLYVQVKGNKNRISTLVYRKKILQDIN